MKIYIYFQRKLSKFKFIFNLYFYCMKSYIYYKCKSLKFKFIININFCSIKIYIYFKCKFSKFKFILNINSHNLNLFWIQIFVTWIFTFILKCKLSKLKLCQVTFIFKCKLVVNENLLKFNINSILFISFIILDETQVLYY